MDTDELLIEEVRNRTILYDLGQPDYKNLKKKELAWREVAAAVKINEIECKKRWKGLRDSYKRCKRLEQVASGSGAEGPKKRWRYFEVMTFLDNVASSRHTTGNISCDLSEDIIEMVEDSSDDFASPVLNYSTSSREKREKKTDSAHFQKFLDFAASSISETCGAVAKQKKEDSTALYFAGLAAKIKAANMPPSVVNQIEAKLSAVVFEEIQLFFSKQQ